MSFLIFNSLIIFFCFFQARFCEIVNIYKIECHSFTFTFIHIVIIQMKLNFICIVRSFCSHSSLHCEIAITHHDHLNLWFFHFNHHIRHSLFILTLWDQLDVKRANYRRASIVSNVKSSRHKTRLTRILLRTRQRVWIRCWKNENNKNIFFHDLSLSLT